MAAPIPPTGGRKQRIAIIGAVATVLIAAAVAGLLVPAGGDVTGPPRSRATGPAIGDLAPEVHATTLAGKKASLWAMRGSTVVLTFWTTWCDACHQTMPWLDDLARRRPGLRVVAVESDGTLGDVQRAVRELHLRSLKVWRDPHAESLHDLYRSHAVPATFVIDGHGVVVNSLMGGAMSEDELALDLFGNQPS
jgi:thiol-disulfide isomerase/thioredoxin